MYIVNIMYTYTMCQSQRRRRRRRPSRLRRRRHRSLPRRPQQHRAEQTVPSRERQSLEYLLSTPPGTPRVLQTSLQVPSCPRRRRPRQARQRRRKLSRRRGRRPPRRRPPTRWPVRCRLSTPEYPSKMADYAGVPALGRRVHVGQQGRQRLRRAVVADRRSGGVRERGRRRGQDVRRRGG